ncbi:MAG: caspase family protein [Saprospiraceae bacterium]|nr:caspase family protein [Saprospiraceae bacterium]
MKNFLLLLALLTGICHPVKSSAQVIDLGTGGTTRAVVIGISDYQNLSDLQFAHRDAEAFAAWLQSKSGGSLPPENILLLLNGQATAGKVGMAFLWLVSESKEGDRAIVYFSGHGDVESKLLNQPGYLLCWDSPANVYMGSGSPSISDIQNVVGTLTLGNKAKVLFITDACRSGHLAGAAIDGVQITNNNLAKPFANEVKILSCQPNELSLEGVQWGGGRGVFSYNLLDGLYGLADRDSDSQVKVKEISRYLEDMVSAQADPQTQNPMVIGDREALLAFVSGEDLAKIKDLKRQEQPTFSPGGQRGHEAALLAKVDTNLQEMYKSFLAAIESGHLMPSPKGQAVAPKGQAGGLSADDYYRMLIKEPTIQQLHGSMTRTLVAALADEAQQVVNKLLRTDPQIVDDAFPGRVRYAHLPDHLARAAEILGERHYMYRYLKCKQYYFEAKAYSKTAYPDLPLDSLHQLTLQALDKALEFDEDAAYVHLEKGLSYYWKVSQAKVATAHFKRAMELSPQWVLALYYYGRSLIHSDNKLAVYWLKEALKRDSTFLPAYERLHFADTEEEASSGGACIFKMEELSRRNPRGSARLLQVFGTGINGAKRMMKPKNTCCKVLR